MPSFISTSPITLPLAREASVLPYSTPLPFEHSVGPWRRGMTLITTPAIVLPDRCVKCNTPAEGFRLKRTFYWHPPALFLLLPLILVFGVVTLLVRKKATIEIGLCPAHRKTRSRWMFAKAMVSLLAVGLLAGGIAIAIISQHTRDQAAIVMIISFGVLIVIGGIIDIGLTRVLIPTRIDDKFAWFRGAGAEFLEPLPTPE